MHHRPVRSFVLREGRLTAGQQRAFETLWPRFGVDWQPGEPLDLPALFDTPQPVALEIGFGNGESLAAQAAAEAERGPGRNFLGLEVHRPGVGHLLLEIERLDLTNLRVMRADARALLRPPPDGGLPDASLTGVQLFFPDPWPKQRHHKRRIVQPDFMRDVARVLAPGGFFHAATDWAPYAAHMLEVIDALPELYQNTAGRGCFAERPASRPPTKFERRGERLGHRVFDLVYRRR
ncbi:MAG: tRNA (guanosine(46)-N7)-methyltransferase TrmB [Thiohalocapsa sp.]|uniref:tRNA (guanosine(46)-N7)-methyltransferase TrmB n=1 Tax=Thiohalocapsa sp. TaxID=2497641 RepID=UPI0025F75527|nr:tRNA (guanosine(46)-N7)-methyltransferase TrmB [Thiohalocapsa sp.]MCG6942955.1 tRNA (guanosine(46)-N7)-methyltransferase TrmB [Thiohalocapsa sp.]